MPTVAKATPQDLEQVLDIAAAGRDAYAGYQPQFWRPAPDARERQRPHFTDLLDDERSIVLVARTGTEVTGFAIGRLVPAPPVYDPGGSSCLVDDLGVADPDRWPVLGPMLLDAVRGWAYERGAAQLVVVTAQLDEGKRACLATGGLTVASEWWVGAARP